jgi:hypothetical protein
MMASEQGGAAAMRKRHIKKAGKKLDAEVKAIVWPELCTRPRVKITTRERAAAKIKNPVTNSWRHIMLPATIPESIIRHVMNKRAVRCGNAELQYRPRSLFPEFNKRLFGGNLPE